MDLPRGRVVASKRDLTGGAENNLTERRAGQVKRETRYDYAAAVAVRYQRSSREQKGWILDEFCAYDRVQPEVRHQAPVWAASSGCAASGSRTPADVWTRGRGCV